jgi:hypothetical protein
MKKQNAGELSKTIAGQWSKSEKRAAASRSIAELNRKTHQTLKRLAQQSKMK